MWYGYMDKKKITPDLVTVLATAEAERQNSHWGKVVCAYAKLHATALGLIPLIREREWVKHYRAMDAKHQEGFIDLMISISQGEAKGYRYGEVSMAFDVLSGIASVYILGREPLPSNLGQWVIEVTSGQIKRPSRRGRGRPATNRYRDAAIVLSIKILRDSHGLPVSHNKASDKQESACHVVAGIFNIAASTVLGIWEKYRVP